MPTNVTWNGVSYAVPNAGELNWASLTNFLVALGTYAAVDEEAKQTIRVATTSPVSVVAGTDYAVVVDLSVAGASVVNLPAGVDGQIFIIVDGKGDAATNNITINPNGAETIGGMASIVMNKNRQVAMVQYHVGSTDWKLTNYSIPIGGVTPADFTGVVPASKGGTGVANNDAATLTRVGNFDVSLTATGATAVTLPTTGTLATLAGAETLTNKNLANANNTLTGATAGSFTNTGTVTLFTATDTVVGRATTDTLSNKTLASPVITTSATFDNEAGAIFEDGATDTATIKAPAALAGTYTMQLPVDMGSSGQVLSTDGNDQLAWVSAGSAMGANVRAAEGAGTTTLTSADNTYQVFDLTANRTVQLPTTGINAGAVWQIEERGAEFDLLIESSNGDDLVTISGGYARFIALQNSPTSLADWEISQQPTIVYSGAVSTNFGSSGAVASIGSESLPAGRYLATFCAQAALNTSDLSFWQLLINTSPSTTSGTTDAVDILNVLPPTGSSNNAGTLSEVLFESGVAFDLYFGILGSYTTGSPLVSASWRVVKI